MWVRGREDAFEERKKVKLKQLKEDYGDDVSWGAEWDIIITTWNVGDYKMESIFPPTAWSQLGHRESEEAGGNKYQGHLYWKYQEINETGDTAGYTDDGMGIWQAPEIPRDEFIDFLSYTYSPASYTACGDNQVLTEAPHISDSVTRTFRVDEVKREQRYKVYTSDYDSIKGGRIWTGRYRTNTVTIRKDVKVVQYEKEYRIEQQSN